MEASETGGKAPVRLVVKINTNSEDKFVTLWLRAFDEVYFDEDKPAIGFVPTAGKQRVTLKSKLALDESLTIDDVRRTLAALPRSVFIFDEFDRGSAEVKKAFTDLIKALSDYSVDSTVVGAVLGIFATLCVEDLKRRRYKPMLTLYHHPNEPGYRNKTKVPGVRPGRHAAVYLRMAVTNKASTIANDCRAYLTAIYEIDQDGNAQETFYADTLRLRWAYEGEDEDQHRGIDIPKGVTIYFDLVSSKRETKDGPEKITTAIQVTNKSARDWYQDKIERNKKYRFHVVVTANGMDPIERQIDVDMGAEWNSLTFIDYGASVSR